MFVQDCLGFICFNFSFVIFQTREDKIKDRIRNITDMEHRYDELQMEKRQVNQGTPEHNCLCYMKEVFDKIKLIKLVGIVPGFIRNGVLDSYLEFWIASRITWTCSYFCFFKCLLDFNFKILLGTFYALFKFLELFS